MPVLYAKMDNEHCNIPFTVGVSVQEITETTGAQVHSACGGVGACGRCRIYIQNGRVNSPTAAEINMLNHSEISKGIRLACQVKPIGDIRVSIDTPILISNWKSLTDKDYSPAFDYRLPPKTIDKADSPYGMAIDLGTTQIRVSFWNMQDGTLISGCSGLNPQAVFGSDVLTRMIRASQSKEDAARLSQIVVDAIDRAFVDMAEKTNITPKEIGRVVIVGNTAMIALLTGKAHDLLLLPDYWTKPIACVPENLEHLVLAWGINIQAKITIASPLAGFVGSDLLAAVIATRLVSGQEKKLLIDFGTNSEIALWDGKLLWVTSAAGGPAFEGCGITCGMPAEAGAIYRARLKEDVSDFLLDTIGGAPPSRYMRIGIG